MVANFTWMSIIMKKHKALTIIVIVLGMGQAVARMGFPWAQKFFIDSVIVPKRPDLLPWAAVLFLGAATLELGVMLLNALVSVLYSQGVVMSLRESIYGRYRESSYRTQSSVAPGHVIARMMSDASTVGETFMNTVPSFGVTAGAFLANMIALIILNHKLFVVSLLFLPVYLIGPSKFSPRLYERGREVQTAVERLNSVLQDGLSGTLDICSMNTASWDLGRIKVAAAHIAQAYKRQALTMQWMGVSILGPLLISNSVLLLVGGYFVLGGSMQLGTLLAYLTYTSAFFNSCKEVVRISASLAGPKAAWDRIREFLDTLDPSYPPGVEGHGVKAQTPKLELNEVSFGYQPEALVLKDVHLSVDPGSVLCVTGASGSGKSTLLQVLAGLLRPLSGTCRVCGIDLSSNGSCAIRSVVTYVPPNPHIFHSTLRENILLGRELSEEQLARICQVACIDEFIQDLPKGLETLLGEKGFSLSLGQQQRVGLARALVAAPKILLLDESLSGLDSEIANRVLGQLKQLQSEGIMVLATHRVDTQEYADRLVVMENGRAVM